MMPVNWAFEAVKWKMLARSISHLSFFQAYKGVLTGLGLGFITPHGLGDYLGRIGQLEEKNRTHLIGAVLVSRLSQMVVTGVAGLWGVYVLFGIRMILIVSGVGIVAVVALFCIRKLGPFVSLRLFKIEKLKPYLDVMIKYNRLDLLKALGYSLLRYTVFSLQFLFMLEMFLPKVSLSLKFAGISWIFLSKSVLPTFNFLSDLGVREASAIFFFEKYKVAVEPVIAASLMLWLTNILLPTLLSSPYIFNLKLSIK